MQPEIRTLPQTHLVGKRLNMSFANNKTRELWQSFMPKRSEINNIIGVEHYSVEVYGDITFFRQFDPNREFEKWAAVKVSDTDSVPDEMEVLTLPEGLYAVFLYKGRAIEASQTYRYIYGTWIPDSEYELDNRPHFALMGEKYKNDDPESEEELWIPVRKSQQG